MNGEQNKPIMLVKDGRVFPAHRVARACGCCDQHTLVRYRSHYGWTLTCLDGCGEMAEGEARTLH